MSRRRGETARRSRPIGLSGAARVCIQAKAVIDSNSNSPLIAMQIRPVIPVRSAMPERLKSAKAVGRKRYALSASGRSALKLIDHEVRANGSVATAAWKVTPRLHLQPGVLHKRSDLQNSMLGSAPWRLATRSSNGSVKNALIASFKSQI